ncbi:unnamed protein product [Echinostoma caproni]|uniref:Tetraspanin n=1 Tax=Echinostoma caproni TaxID=27848 RepID=A0A183ALT5_9TREM|nr:unnamed protein product [Echinostoma caproni]
MEMKIKPRVCIWAVLCTWLLLSTAALSIVVMLLYMYDSTLKSFFGEPMTRLSQTSSVILAGWMLVTFGAAIRSAKANRRSMGMIFFLFALLGFAGEILIMIALAQYRNNVFGLALLNEATLRLVRAYNQSEVARNVLDLIHLRFDCCGVDEWHQEWKQVGPYPPRDDSSVDEPWVPYSCCRGILRISPTCGFARIRHPITRAQRVRSFEYGLETVIPEPWYANLQNEPCPERLFEWLAEIPIYALMIGLALAVSRMMIATYAVFMYSRRRGRRRRRR